MELAGEVNTAMPQRVVARVDAALQAKGKTLRGSRVLVLGLAYKAEVDDDRESPSYRLMDLLDEAGATVAYHDPYVPVIRPSRRHAHWAGTHSVTWDTATIGGFDVVLIATMHVAVNREELAAWAKLIVDTRNAMTGIVAAAGKVWKA